MSRITMALILAGLLALPLTPRTVAALDPTTLPAVIYHPSGISYWDTPYFANAMLNGGGWMVFQPGQWGNRIATWNVPEFDANGYPQEMMPGLRYRFIPFGLHTDTGNRPAHWPKRGRAAQGKVVLTWQGEADIRLAGGGTYLAGESSGASTGLLLNGRRTYLFEGQSQLQWMEVWDIAGGTPLNDIRIWLADPADPTNATLEGQLFHPTFLARLREADWGAIRYMNWSNTNGNPERDWSDRRKPSHAFMTGALNPRAPSSTSSGPRDSGIAWELCVALSNESNLDLWINVPHLATDDYVRNLARLIRFGSDGDLPYTAPVADPVWPPLAAGRRVYIEYSNEIWSSGASFPQGDWAQEQAAAMGISKPRFNARRFCEVFSIFQDVYGGSDDLIRVAAVFTANNSYNQAFLQEMAAYGPTLTPAVEPDVIAVTTYFGNGIQDYAHERAIAEAGGNDPWFYTGATFHAGGGNMHPVSVPVSDVYWSSDALERHLNETFAEWEYRMLAGDTREGAGPDAVGIGGGFGHDIRQLALNAFSSPKPIIAYEGGPSLYTDDYDWGDSRDDGVTVFMEALNRHPRFREVYRIHLNMAKARGLWSHSMFTDSGQWGKYGQWGHLEYIEQPNADAPKYQFLLDWMNEQSSIRHVDMPQGASPSFATAHQLPVAVYGVAYEAPIMTTGGDGGRSLEVIGASLRAGLSFTPGVAGSGTIAGLPQEAGRSFAYLRVLDADGDPEWRTFTIRTVGGPDTLLEVRFDGTNISSQTPWTETYIHVSDALYSGLIRGSGTLAAAGNNAFVWTQIMPAVENDSTLEVAIADEEYLAFTIGPAAGKVMDLAGHEMRFSIRRLSFHAPRRYAVLTSVDGFAAARAIFTTARSGGEADLEYRFTLPDADVYDGLTIPVEFRIYGFSGQYAGHATSLIELRLDGAIRDQQSGLAASWKVY